MWSENKKIDLVIEVLLYLTAINFFHAGQIFVPIICLIILIDNHFSFYVNNMKTFIVLCLFGLSFLLFSYKLGPYCIVGLLCPMAYYIGSNIKEKSEESYKKALYTLMLGMCSLVVLDFIGECFIFGPEVFTTRSHRDFWTKKSTPETQTVVNYTLLLGSVYYIMYYENKTKKKLLLSLFIFLMLYNIRLGRRSPILILFISIIISVLVDYFIQKNRTFNKKLVLGLSLLTIIAVAVFAVFFSLNIMNFQVYVLNMRIVQKIVLNGSWYTGRTEIFIESLKLFPNHLWGGQEVSSILGIQVHNLWFDAFDYAGIITFILLVYHTYLFISIFVKMIKKDMSKELILLNLTLFSCILTQMLIEPIMTGSSIFLISVIILESSLECVYQNEE